MYCFTNNFCFIIYFYVKKSRPNLIQSRSFYICTSQPYNIHAILAQIVNFSTIYSSTYSAIFRQIFHFFSAIFWGGLIHNYQNILQRVLFFPHFQEKCERKTVSFLHFIAYSVSYYYSIHTTPITKMIRMNHDFLY